MVARPSAQLCFSLFLIKAASSKYDLGQLGIEIIRNALSASLPAHSRISGAAEGSLGSGQGEAMAANRVKGARAAVFYGPMRVTEALDREGGRSEDGFDAVRLPRRHNDANILSIGARFAGGFEADEAVRIFLETEFSGAERHARRIAKF